MDFTFTEEQQAATEAAKAVFSGVVPDGVPSPALVPGAVAEDIDRPLWAGLASGDLLSLTLSPEHGGAGLDLVALCLVLRESAKVLARVPLLETCAVAMALQRYGNPRLAAELLPRVGRGELVLTAGANGRTGHDPAELAVTARREAAAGTDAGCQCRCRCRLLTALVPVAEPTLTAAGCSTGRSQRCRGRRRRTGSRFRPTSTRAGPSSPDPVGPGRRHPGRAGLHQR